MICGAERRQGYQLILLGSGLGIIGRLFFGSNRGASGVI